MSVLSVHNLSVSAWGARLLNHVSFSIKQGELMAVIGPNGAGKTTLINALTHALPQAHTLSGEMTLCGHKQSDWSAQARAKCVAVLPQSSSLAFPFTVYEVVQLGRMPHKTGKQTDHQIIQQALKALDIVHLQARLYPQLSGGEKQRVQLARVMVQIWRGEDAGDDSVTQSNYGARLLLLDEPTSSLDLGHQQQLMQVIRYFADQGVAIMMVAHDINLASSHADTLLALCCGEIVNQGSPETVVTPELMQALYQVEADIVKHPSTNKPIVIANAMTM